MDPLARLDSQPDLLYATTPQAPGDFDFELDQAYFPQLTPRVGDWPFFAQRQIPPGPEPETPGAKRRRSITPQQEQEEQAEVETPGAKRRRSITPQQEQDVDEVKKLTPKELATKARRFAEAHYVNLRTKSYRSPIHTVIEANTIPNLNKDQVQELEKHHKSFLQRQIIAMQFLSQESCWQSGRFICKYKKIGGKECRFSTTRRSGALIHIEGKEHLETGAYFCIQCLLAGKMHIDPQPQNVRAHIHKNHGQEHVESGVGIFSSIDGYNSNTPEDKPVEPEAQQQEPADKQPDMRVSTYKVSDAPQPIAPIQPDTQHVQIETCKIKVDAGIQTDQTREIATQTDTQHNHPSQPVQKKRRIEDPAAFLDKKREALREATDLCSSFYNSRNAWPTSTKFQCTCKIAEGVKCGTEIKKHQHKHNLRQVVLEHLSTVHFNRKSSYCSICLNSGTWVAGSNKELREHAKFLHGNDTSCVQTLSRERVANTVSHRADNIEVNREAIYLTAETTDTEINLGNLGDKKVSKEKALQLAKENYLKFLRARFCCETCLNQKNVLIVRDTKFSINEHSNIYHKDMDAMIVDLATHR